MLTEEQLQKIKISLLEQLENFPEEQRKIIKHKILSMNTQEMEEFMKENGMSKTDKGEEQPKCIFCAIVKNKIASYKISEDKNFIAILELNPLSKGHTLIIPKEHVSIDKLSEDSINFAKEVSKKIFEKLKPKDVQFQKNEILGHADLEIIPVYETESSERKKATEEELKKLQLEITGNIPTEKKKEEKPIVKEELPKIEKPTEENKQEKIIAKEELPKIKPRTSWI